MQIDVREDKIRELKLLHETSKETESKHLALVTSLRARLSEYEAQAGDIEGNPVLWFRNVLGCRLVLQKVEWELLYLREKKVLAYLRFSCFCMYNVDVLFLYWPLYLVITYVLIRKIDVLYVSHGVKEL